MRMTGQQSSLACCSFWQMKMMNLNVKTTTTTKSDCKTTGAGTKARRRWETSGCALWLRAWLQAHSRWPPAPASRQHPGHKSWSKFCEYRQGGAKTQEASFCTYPRCRVSGAVAAGQEGGRQAGVGPRAGAGCARGSSLGCWQPVDAWLQKQGRRTPLFPL